MEMITDQQRAARIRFQVEHRMRAVHLVAIVDARADAMALTAEALRALVIQERKGVPAGKAALGHSVRQRQRSQSL